jgi:hypothetical protein
MMCCPECERKAYALFEKMGNPNGCVTMGCYGDKDNTFCECGAVLQGQQTLF